MKYGILVFPGSNCDRDAFFAGSLNGKAEFIWHKDTSIPSDIDCIIIPGPSPYYGVGIATVGIALVGIIPWNRGYSCLVHDHSV